MIILNNFSIVNDATGLAIDVETNVGFNITSINLWAMNDFKDYTLAKSLDFKLEQVNNKEVFIVNAEEIGLTLFEDIYFIEIESDYEDEEAECTNCTDPALGITYNLSSYYQCILNYYLETDLTCKSCKDSYNNEIIISIALLIEMIQNAIEVGFYTQAIDMVGYLKKLCSTKKCNNCKPINCTSCGKFKQY